jgi:hypothetical protein
VGLGYSVLVLSQLFTFRAHRGDIAGPEPTLTTSLVQWVLYFHVLVYFSDRCCMLRDALTNLLLWCHVMQGTRR